MSVSAVVARPEDVIFHEQRPLTTTAAAGNSWTVDDMEAGHDTEVCGKPKKDVFELLVLRCRVPLVGGRSAMW